MKKFCNKQMINFWLVKCCSVTQYWMKSRPISRLSVRSYVSIFCPFVMVVKFFTWVAVFMPKKAFGTKSSQNYPIIFYLTVNLFSKGLLESVSVTFRILCSCRNNFLLTSFCIQNFLDLWLNSSIEYSNDNSASSHSNLYFSRWDM